jgi:hypothetical protein
MHPSWSQGVAVARQRAPLRLAALVAAVIAAAVAVAGCGHSAAAPAAAASAGPKATICGTARTVANVPVKVEVTKGKVKCHAALTVERDYTKAIAAGKAPGNGGGGPLTIKGWKCQGFATPRVLKTGWASQCVRSGTQILAILPPPS